MVINPIINHEYHCVDLDIHAYEISKYREIKQWLDERMGPPSPRTWFSRSNNTFIRICFYKPQDHLMFLLSWGTNESTVQS